MTPPPAPGALYILGVGLGELSLLSERALHRLRTADVVLATTTLDPRWLAMVDDRLRIGDPQRFLQQGLSVAWLVDTMPAPPAQGPWEYLPAVTEVQHGGRIRPLQGMGVIVTRPRDQAHHLMHMLELMGARAYSIPSIELVPPPSFEAIDSALTSLASFHWIIFTSANAVDPFMARVKDMRRLAHLRIATIGPATAEALHRYHVKSDLTPPEHVAEGLLDAFPDVRGTRVLLPRAVSARDVLPTGLRERGAFVVVAPVYETVANEAAGPLFEQLLQQRRVDVVTFSAASTVTNFPVAPPPEIRIVCIGPVTAKTARDRGWRVDAQASEYTSDGLLQALIHLSRSSGPTST